MTLPAAPFDEHDRKSLEALANVVKLCVPDRPCNSGDCKRCNDRWNNAMEQTDIDENSIWGFEE